MGLEQYDSEKISKANEIELDQMMKQFKKQEVSPLKLGIFMGFNFAALTGLLFFSKWFVKSRMVKRGEKGRMQKSQLTLANLFRRGATLGAVIGGVYVTSALIVGYYTMPFSIFKKYCELQQALQSFSVIYDPYCQQAMLFRKMKKFGLSDELAKQIKADISARKEKLIEGKILKDETIEIIRKAEKDFFQSNNSAQVL